MMDRATIEAYEERGLAWASRREPVRRAHARAFTKRVNRGDLRIDLGCGAGRYISDLGKPVIGLDAANAMLRACAVSAPESLLVQADLEHLPLARGRIGGAWANMSYLHVQSARLPVALADLHRVLRVGSPVDLQLLAGDYEGSSLPDDEVGGRFFAAWKPEALIDIVEGAGFEVEAMQVDGDVVRVRASALRTLADFVGPGMRLLVIGLNPSLFAADAGVGFARGGNRFWPAALAAGLVTRDRDPFHALFAHGVGMSDVVKRATTSARELAPREYRTGMARLERLCRWLSPKAVCFVGLAGWRCAVDRDAKPGLQAQRLGGCTVYLMPSTSGANAREPLDHLANHLGAALAVSEAS